MKIPKTRNCLIHNTSSHLLIVLRQGIMTVCILAYLILPLGRTVFCLPFAEAVHRLAQFASLL